MVEEPLAERSTDLGALGTLRGLNEYMIFVAGIVLLAMAPYLLGRIIFEFAQAHFVIWVQVVILAVFFLLLSAWAWLISGDRGVRLFRAGYQRGIKWPLLFSVSMLVFAILPFSALSSILADTGYSVLEPSVPRGEFWRLHDLYLWHFFGSVPALKIPETLHWEEPYKYRDLSSGVLLLTFKLVVIVPVIASFTMWRRIRRERRAADVESGSMGPRAREEKQTG